MRFFEVESAVDAIMSAAMLAQTKAGSRNKQGQLSMNGFLQMLANAGIVVDYEGFKTVFDTNPQLANVIDKFDKNTITFTSAEADDEDAVDNTKPSNQIPDDERISKMARRAVRTREDIEITEGAIDTLKMIVANKLNMPVKFQDGSMKVDLFTASAITKVYDAVNDANKAKLERMMQTKAGMMRVQDFAMDQIKTEDKEVEESGILYKAGLKKYGEKGMKKIQSAAGKGASAEEIGKIKDQYNKKKKMNADIHEDEKDDAKLMIQQLREISEHRRMLENMIIKLAELNKSSGDLTDQLQTMFDLNTKFSAVLRRSMSIVPVYEDKPDKSARGLIALRKQYDELTDQNQHGQAALVLAQTLGTSDDVEIIKAINARHMKRGSISKGEQTLRDEIANSLYRTMMQGQFDLPESTMKKEGFASDAQRKAAFASGYDPSKKKKKESMYESMMDRIEKDIDAGMSTDAIIGKYANRATTNTDKIRAMIQKIKFKKFRSK